MGDTRDDCSDSSGDESEEDVKPKLIKLEDISDESDSVDEEIARPPKKRKNPINLHIREIARKIPRTSSGRVECSQCGRMVLFYVGKCKAIEYHSLVDHATHHLKKALYECQFCHRTMNKPNMKIHMISRHKAEHVKLTPNASAGYKMVDGIEDEVKEMLTTCFGKRQNGRKGKESDSKAFYQIELHAQRLWKCRPSAQSLQCNQCSHCIRIPLVNRPAHITCALLEHHASMHLGRSLYKCKPCGITKSTKQAIRQHLQRSHALSSSEKNYEDMRAGSKEAIIAAMDRCFAPLGDPALEVEAMEEGEKKWKRPDSTQILKARFGRNELELERRLHCSNLLKKHTKSGTIKCRTCEHHIGVNQHGTRWISNQKPLLHSFTHLKDGIHLFKCKRCQQPIKDMFSVYRHMKSKHQMESRKRSVISPTTIIERSWRI